VVLLDGNGPGNGAAPNFLRLLREADADAFDYIALADQDDIWLPNRLSRAASLLRRYSAGGYSSDALAFWPDGRRARLRKTHRHRCFDYLLESAGAGCTYVMSSGFFERLQLELKQEPARFDATSYHVWLIYVFARTHDYSWHFDDHVGVHYRQHDSNEVGANVGLRAIVRRWRRARSGLYRQKVLHMARLWPDKHLQLIQRFERFNLTDRLALALQTDQLRRRPRDRLALFLMLLLGILG
jgi:rhamnosyltransferase